MSDDGLSKLPVVLAVIVLLAGAAGLVLWAPSAPQAAPEVTAQPAVATAVDLARAPVPSTAFPEPDDADIPHVERLPGYGAFDGETYQRAQALAALHDVDELSTRLAKARPERKADLARAIGIKGAGTDAGQAAQILSPLLKQRNRGARAGAIDGLAQLGEIGLAALVEGLRDAATGNGNLELQGELIEAMGTLGSGNDTAIGALMERVQNSSDLGLQMAAVQALGGMGGSAESTLVDLQNMLRSEGGNLAANPLLQQIETSLAEAQQPVAGP